MSHEQAKKELAAGTPAEVICTTCPWDRLCIEPPKMSAAEIKKLVDDAEQKDRQNDPFGRKMPAQMLMTALTFAGRDSQGTLCPVFALRLRGPDGRQVADSIRTTMRGWGDPS
jgi:hypothetical protein